MVTQTELYRFHEANSDDVWTYTSGDEAVDYLGDTYIPISISREGIEVKGELARANISVKLSLANSAAQGWLSNHGELLVGLTIYERSTAGTFAVIWKGRLAGVEPGMTDISLSFESIFTSLRRSGLRARYQRLCRHALYGRGCKLDAEAFAVAATLTDISGRVVTVAEAALQPDDYYTGGMLRDPSGALSYIVEHAGESLTIQRIPASLSGAFTESEGSIAVDIYPGCDHTIETCWTKFDNGLNCGCFKWIPLKNPMGGSSII